MWRAEISEDRALLGPCQWIIELMETDKIQCVKYVTTCAFE